MYKTREPFYMCAVIRELRRYVSLSLLNSPAGSSPRIFLAELRALIIELASREFPGLNISLGSRPFWNVAA